MADHALAAFTIIASSSNAASAVKSGAVIDLWGLGLASKPDGGTLYLRLANGATPPSTAGEMVVVESLELGNTPPGAPLVPSTDTWRQVHAFNSGTAANEATTSTYRFGPFVRYISVIVRGNTGQAVTCEAVGTAGAY